jgi:hypothetical protein
LERFTRGRPHLKPGDDPGRNGAVNPVLAASGEAFAGTAHVGTNAPMRFGWRGRGRGNFQVHLLTE